MLPFFLLCAIAAPVALCAGGAPTIPARDAEASSLRFMSFGDWGGLPTWPYKTFREEATAKELGHLASTFSSEFFLVLGDNFYFDGVSSVSDERWARTYEDVFTAKSLDKPWYVVLGNHDHYGGEASVAAELAYGSGETRWQIPSLYYAFEKQVPGTNETVLFVMFDAVTLVGGSHDDVEGPAAGPADDARLAADQMAWIESTLANATQDWIVMGSHYPVFSASEHGSTPFLVENLQPLIEKYGVAAYLNGHDHNCQAVEYKGTWYLTLGGANFLKNSDKHKHTVPPGSLKFQWPTKDDQLSGCFGALEISGNGMESFIVATDGEVLWNSTAQNPRKMMRRE